MNCLCCAIDPLTMFTNGVWMWLILLWGSLLAKNGILVTSVGSRNMNFYFVSALLWGNFGTSFWWILSCQQKVVAETASLLLTIKFRIHQKTWEGLSSCQNSHMTSLSAPSCQRTNENVHDLAGRRYISKLSVPWFIILLGVSSFLYPFICFVGCQCHV